MILTCPDCATRYFVDEARLGPAGRTVRCASCGSSWRAEPPELPLDLTSAPPESPQPQTAPEASPPKAAPGPVHAEFRAKVEAKRKTREAVAAGVVWGVLAAGFAVLLLTAIVFRVQVVRLWPRTAGAYAAVRLPVNPLGLVPENIQASQALQDGRLALVVTGAERNILPDPRPPAPLRVSLLDKSGKTLAARLVPGSAAPIAPGDSRSFSTSFIDPPIAASDVRIDFVFDAPPSPRPAHAVKRTVVSLRGPVAAPPPPLRPAVEAKPLAPGSRYALPPAAREASEPLSLRLHG